MEMPKRSSKFGVGKEIGGKVYMHISYAKDTLPSAQFAAAKMVLNELWLPSASKTTPEAANRAVDDVFNVVSYNMKTGDFTFTISKDFDRVDEPTIGKQILIRPDGSFRIIEPNEDNPYIYHHKWLFVKDDYKGFDVRASKRRSEKWLSLSDVDFSRIGRKQFWERTVVARLNFGIDVDTLDEIITDMEYKYPENYETKPIGGGNPYYCCVYCEKADPGISIEGHFKDCEWAKGRKQLERLKELRKKITGE